MDEMDVLGILRAIFGLILILFIPGYAITWALFPIREEREFLERIAFSFVLSIVSVILSVLFIDIILGIDTTPENIFITILLLTAIATGIWKLEISYLESSLKRRFDQKRNGKMGMETFDISLIRDRIEPEITKGIKSDQKDSKSELDEDEMSEFNEKSQNEISEENGKKNMGIIYEIPINIPHKERDLKSWSLLKSTSGIGKYLKMEDHDEKK
ncbi:DUF1616 domain-containing protein [Methanoplanus sp. FWC-SCC4]|uniref:DUF1616 domain-containing protein n=1 Tax=Methanochimaera problematica TaxID=2609417 RepID=A0AA97FDN9_9EURY|nr:DUF1616 domain-containing protein [Methanoplanus sp. FWC-SCC4]WOF16353.1 DUF1616 domain-containing protein [Methanoplanus sp. FWC-SCC4]